MTPAITFAKKQQLDFKLHRYEHDSNVASYGLEAVEKLGVTAECVFKTLVVADDCGKLAVAVIPVAKQLSFKKLAKSLGVKKVTMAAPHVVTSTTGYVLGGVSPLGQKKRLVTVIDTLSLEQRSIFVSAGKRGIEIELSPQTLAQAVSAMVTDISV